MTIRRNAATIAVVAATGGALAALLVTLPAPVSNTVTGTVRCDSGAAVAGVWVEAFSGGRGFADRSDTGSGAALFQKYLPNGGTYRLDVGCGADGKDWLVTARSDALTRVHHDTVVCHDEPTRLDYRTCTVSP